MTSSSTSSSTSTPPSLSVALLGSTGMVGSHILHTLQNHPAIHTIHTISRRQPPFQPHPKTQCHISNDTNTWSPTLTSSTPSPSILISSLATTRGAAGSLQKQYELEHDLNVSLARAAKDLGSIKTYILISSAGANSDSYLAYPRMKGEIETNIRALGFERTIILRPGLIAGQRAEKRAAEAVLRKVADWMGKVSETWLKDGWAQEAEVIARAAVEAGLRGERGEGMSDDQKVWVLGQSDIVRLGRTEWGRK